MTPRYGQHSATYAMVWLMTWGRCYWVFQCLFVKQDQGTISCQELMVFRALAKARERSKVSQPVFARYLNTSASMVKQWESGEKHPRGMALKLLSLVQKHGIEILA